MARTVEDRDDTQIIFHKAETVCRDQEHVDKLCTTKMNSKD